MSAPRPERADYGTSGSGVQPSGTPPDERVAAFGDIGWDVDQGTPDGWSLILTPQGQREGLPITHHLVALAPRISAAAAQVIGGVKRLPSW